MKKTIALGAIVLGLVAAALAGTAVPAKAQVAVPTQAHHILHNGTPPTVTCTGASSSFTDFPSGIQTVTFHYKIGTDDYKTADAHFTGPAGPASVSFTVTGQTTVSVYVTWTADGGGQTDTTTKSLDCGPPPSDCEMRGGEDCLQKIYITKVFDPHNSVLTADFFVSNDQTGFMQEQGGVHDGGTVSFPVDTGSHSIIEGGAGLQGFIAHISCDNGSTTWKVVVVANHDIRCKVTNTTPPCEGSACQPPPPPITPPVTPPTPLPAVNLGISKTASTSTPAPGSTVTYTIKVTNQSPDKYGHTDGVASNVNVVDKLPAGVTFVSATPSQGVCVNGGTLCELGSLKPGDSATIAVVVTVTAASGTTLQNCAGTYSNGGDSDYNDNTSCATITVTTPVVTPPPTPTPTPTPKPPVKHPKPKPPVKHHHKKHHPKPPLKRQGNTQ